MSTAPVISAATPRFKTYTAAAGQTDFPIPFAYFAQAEVLAEVRRDGELVASYQGGVGGVSCDPVADASVVASVAGTLTLPAQTEDDEVTVWVLTDGKRDHTFSDGGEFKGSQINRELTRGQARDLELRRDIDRAVLARPGVAGQELPDPQSNTVLGWVGGALKNVALATVSAVAVATSWLTILGADVGAGWANTLASDREDVLREKLTAPRTYHVNHALGSDANKGVSAGVLAFRTITHAFAHIRDNVDMSGYQVIIQVADGTFDEVIICSGVPHGYRDLNSLIVRGNTITPSACLNSHAGDYPCLSVYENCFVRFEGMKFENPNALDHCVKAYRGAYLEVAKVSLGDAARFCVQAADGWIACVGRGTVPAAIEFAGDAWGGCVVEVGNGGFDVTGATVTFTDTPEFTGHPASAFINCGEGGYYGNYETIYEDSFIGRPYYISDQAVGEPADRLETIPGSALGVWTHNSLSAPQGRLTLEDGVPVSATDQLAKTTLYYVPDVGDYGMFSSVGADQYEMATFGSLSLALDSNSGHDLFHAANSLFDVYLIRIDAAFYMATGQAWTNDTTPAEAISRPNGVLANTSAITVRYGAGADDTHGLAAGEGVWIGTIGTTGVAGQTEDSEAKRLVWNNYNRRVRQMRRLESTDTWSQLSSAWQQANGSSANQLEFVRGSDEDGVSAHVLAEVSHSGATPIPARVAVGLGSTTPVGLIGVAAIDSAAFRAAVAHYEGQPGRGRRTLKWLESGGSSGTTTWRGDAGVTFVQSGIAGSVVA